MDRGKAIGISASKGAAILSREFNAYQTEFEIWQGWIEKVHPGINAELGYTMPERPTGPALAWGHAFEDAIARLAEEKTGGKIVAREQFLSVSDPVPMLGYIDGRYQSGQTHEAKTTSYFYWKDNFGEPGSDRVPASYQVQVAHYMALDQLTGVDTKETILSVLVFPKRVEEFEKDGWTTEQVNLVDNISADCGLKNDSRGLTRSPVTWAETLDQMGYFHQYHIPRNQRLIDLMLEHYAEWWNKHIIGCTPPEPTTYDDIIRLCPSPVGTIICDDPELTDPKVKKDPTGKTLYQKYNDDIKKIQKNKEAIKIGLLNYARKNTHQTAQSCPVDRHLIQTRCHGECGLDRCVVGDMVAAIDDNSKDKWLILSPDGKKVASYSVKNGRANFR